MILRLTFIALAFLLLSRCATVPLTGRHQLILFPEDQMVSMSLTSYSSFLKENKLSTDAVNKQRIKMQDEINRHLTALWQLRQEAIKLGGTYHGRVKTHRNKKR